MNEKDFYFCLLDPMTNSTCPRLGPRRGKEKLDNILPKFYKEENLSYDMYYSFLLL